VLTIALTGVLVAGVIGLLAGRLQNRADEPVPGSRSVVTFDVDAYDVLQPVEEAARALWYACNTTIPSHLESLTITAGGNGVATLEPAMGAHDRKRLTGCMHDATLDRIRGEVISIVDDLPADTGGPQQ
jgi:hypothetical protein